MEHRSIASTATAFFSGLIDYAGLFPPAALSLEESLKNYRCYQESSHHWILSRFILTPSHLAQIPPSSVELFSPQKPLPLSLVSKNPAVEIPVAKSRIDSLAGRLSLGCIEVPLATTESISAQITTCLQSLLRIEGTRESTSVFFEIPSSPTWDHLLSEMLGALSSARRVTKRMVGLKLRCGGTEPHLTPTPSRVAAAILGSAQHSIPIKFTAGLHHPFQRHMHGTAGVCVSDSMHGYFNVFFAALAAHAHALSQERIIEILLRDDAAQPKLGDEVITWGETAIPVAEVARLRSSMVISFGSCSFTEPLEDASRLGWL